MNAYMLREFSRRTVAGLKRYALFKLLLPPFKTFLDINLDKELDKHREVIAVARAAARSGTPPGPAETEQLLQRARAIDQEFLRKAQSVSAALDIRYPEIDPIRRRRFELVSTAAYQILDGWGAGTRFRTAIRGRYPREQFHSLLREILNLYIQETGALSRSVKIPRALARFSDALIAAVHAAMQEAAGQLALELTDKVYRRQA
jgi:hypothetical protein